MIERNTPYPDNLNQPKAQMTMQNKEKKLT